MWTNRSQRTKELKTTTIILMRMTRKMTVQFFVAWRDALHRWVRCARETTRKMMVKNDEKTQRQQQQQNQKRPDAVQVK